MFEQRIDGQTDFSSLRARAEDLLRGQPRELEKLSSTEMQHLIHELQVHQIELELQNDELRRTQLELEVARDRYFDLYDLAPVGYFTLDRNGLILEVNLTGAALLGTDRRELINTPFSVFVTSDSQDDFFLHRQRILEGGAVQAGELSMLTKDRTRFEARLESVAVPRGENPEEVVCRTIVSNITEKVQAEEAIRQRNATLALLFRIGRELTAVLNLEQLTERLLPAVIETLNADGASVWLRDETDGDWLVYHGVAQERILSPVKVCAVQDGSLIAQVIENGKSAIAPDPQYHPGMSPTVDKVTGIPIHSALAVPLRVRGKVIGALQLINEKPGVFDETNLTLVETLAGSAAIAIDNARLIEVLEKYTVALQARNEELDAFAHTLAHSFTNSVARIVLGGDWLRHELRELSWQTIEEQLSRIVVTARRMGEEVDALLLLSGASGLNNVTRERFAVGSTVARALEDLSDLIEEYQAEVVLPENWPEVLGYQPWVEVIWANYISNAIKYGGRPPLVETGYTSSIDGTVRFWVRDNGAGLTADEQARLFTPFERLVHSDVRGFGLGLSIVRRIVTQLGGEAGVESAGIAGNGSVFYFTLPVE